MHSRRLPNEDCQLQGAGYAEEEESQVAETRLRVVRRAGLGHAGQVFDAGRRPGSFPARGSELPPGRDCNRSEKNHCQSRGHIRSVDRQLCSVRYDDELRIDISIGYDN